MTATASLRVLLVDDDFALRTAVGWMLHAMGHRVSLAASGPEALEAFHQGLEVDLVLLDLCMPVMDGQEIMSHLMTLRPGQAVLMMSGMIRNRVAEVMAAWPTVPFLAKPFSREELQAAIEAMAVLSGA